VPRLFRFFFLDVPNAHDTPYLERGSRAYWRASIALLFAGYATFSLLYCVQPLLPSFSSAFGVTPAQSSLTVSLSTAALAFSIFTAGFVSEGWSRHKLMTLSLTVSALLTIGVAIAPQWHQLLALRALEGLALGGVPAVAMAYLAEEVHPDGLGLAMGLYVGGTAIGGMAGRVITGVVADLFSWRVAIGTIGVLGILSMLAFRALLPPSRHFGAIMCIGIATANSILVISFAREQLLEHGDATRAAIEAGFTRFRPVLMTALAMVIGMVPMAIGFGEGGEQNAPLGRAVIGGLTIGTLATLIFVPVVFSMIYRRLAARRLRAAEHVVGKP